MKAIQPHLTHDTAHSASPVAWGWLESPFLRISRNGKGHGGWLLAVLVWSLKPVARWARGPSEKPLAQHCQWGPWGGEVNCWARGSVSRPASSHLLVTLMYDHAGLLWPSAMTREERQGQGLAHSWHWLNGSCKIRMALQTGRAGSGGLYLKGSHWHKWPYCCPKMNAKRGSQHPCQHWLFSLRKLSLDRWKLVPYSFPLYFFD